MQTKDTRPINGRRYLIVNADDFGYSAGINRGILEAHERGIVTSASLMVRGPAADEAAFASRACPGLSLGLHVDLGEWAYRDGEWVEMYRVVDVDHPAAVEREVERQVETFCELTGRQPTHLDSHQHVHRQEPVRSVLRELGQQLHAAVRDDSAGMNYCGAFYGQTNTGEPLDDEISIQALIGVLKRLPLGITELGCHPGFADDVDTMYACQRSAEIATLCSGEVRAVLGEMGIELVSFHDLAFAFSSLAIAAGPRAAACMEARA